jgi:hypothetical protein
MTIKLLDVGLEVAETDEEREDRLRLEHYDDLYLQWMQEEMDD